MRGSLRPRFAALLMTLLCAALPASTALAGAPVRRAFFRACVTVKGAHRSGERPALRMTAAAECRAQRTPRSLALRHLAALDHPAQPAPGQS